MFYELNIYSQRHIHRASPTVQFVVQLGWDLAPSLDQSSTARAECDQNRLSEGSAAEVSLRSHKWLSKQCPVFSQPPPRWLQAQASGHSEASNGLLLWKGLGMGWKEKVFNSDNLRYLSAGHGSAWRNEKDMDTQPMTAARVPQLLKLQLAVTEGGLWDKGKGKREVPL